MASRGNVPPGKETLKVYVDKALKRQLQLTAADWDESYSSIVERGLRWILEHGRPTREVRSVEWREDRELLSSDKTGEARMCYSAEMGPDMTGAIYEAADGVCAWYLWDRESGVELAAGQVDSLDEAQEAAERAAIEHGHECDNCSANGIETPATRYALGRHLCDECAAEYEALLRPGERLEDMTQAEIDARLYS